MCLFISVLHRIFGHLLFAFLEAQSQLEARKASMRSVGVGDGDVNHVEQVKVKETEVKTVYIEPDKPEQRNVGLQVCVHPTFHNPQSCSVSEATESSIYPAGGSQISRYPDLHIRVHVFRVVGLKERLKFAGQGTY